MQPIAKQGDSIKAVDIHVVVVNGVPTPTPTPFDGTLVEDLSPDVIAEHRAVAVVGSRAKNEPAHVAIGGSFQRAPKNEAKVVTGSGIVLVNGKPIARNGDQADTCNDPVDLPNGSVSSIGTVVSG